MHLINTILPIITTLTLASCARYKPKGSLTKIDSANMGRAFRELYPVESGEQRFSFAAKGFSKNVPSAEIKVDHQAPGKILISRHKDACVIRFHNDETSSPLTFETIPDSSDSKSHTLSLDRDYVDEEPFYDELDVQDDDMVIILLPTQKDTQKNSDSECTLSNIAQSFVAINEIDPGVRIKRAVESNCRNGTIVLAALRYHDE